MLLKYYTETYVQIFINHLALLRGRTGHMAGPCYSGGYE